MRIINTVALTACVLAMPAIAQQSGELDPSFDGDGIVFTHTQAGANEHGRCIAVQPDGRILVGGFLSHQGMAGYSTLLVRYMPDGALDGSFGVGGLVTLIIGGQTECEHYIKSIALQPDGRIVAVGSSQVVGIGVHSAILRFNADGTLDNTFSDDGIRLDDIVPYYDTYKDLVIQPDGRIVATGYADVDATRDVVVARYLANGTPDNEFSGDGFEITNIEGDLNEAHAVVLQPDGRIVIGGRSLSEDSANFLLVRYTTNGVLDTDFGNGGVVTSNFSTYADYAFALAIQPDGRLLAGGYVSADIAGNMAVVRYTGDGMLDASFGTGGLAEVEHGIGSSVYSMALLPDGRIALGGRSGGQLAAAMLLPDGTLDTGFSGDGLVGHLLGTISYDGVVTLQPDGKLLLAGTRVSTSTFADIVVLRYFTELDIGMLELDGVDQAPLIYPDPIGATATLQYALRNSERISIRLVDASGRIVHTFLEGVAQQAGDHRLELDFPATIAAGGYTLTIYSAARGQVSVQVVKE